jgi:hypothetical protein
MGTSANRDRKKNTIRQNMGYARQFTFPSVDPFIAERELKFALDSGQTNI